MLNHSSSSSVAPTGVRRICLRSSLISNSSPGFRSSLRIRLADEKIAVALQSGHIAEFAATFALTANTTHAKTDAFRLQQCFIKSGEIQALTTIFFSVDIAIGTKDQTF